MRASDIEDALFVCKTCRINIINSNIPITLKATKDICTEEKDTSNHFGAV